MTHQAFRYELDPTPSQRVLLMKHAGTRRRVWNDGLRWRVQWWEENKNKPDDERSPRPNAASQEKEFVTLKKTTLPWLAEISKWVVSSALRDLDKAFVDFFRRVKNGEKPGFPRPKIKGVCRESFRLHGLPGEIRLAGRRAVLPKLGKIRLKDGLTQLSRLAGRVLSATVSQAADRWFVSICVERASVSQIPVIGPTVGVDLGLTTFAMLVSSDGSVEKIKAPKPLKAKLELLALRQRRHAKKQNGSANRKKSAMRIARLHWRISNVRKDFLNKLTTRLAKTKSVVVVEDLNVEGMKKRYGRHVEDVGFYEFRRQLAYKTVWYGSRLVVADRFYASTKTCSVCQVVKSAIALDERFWTCSGCGAVHDRDENAAKNLARLGATAGSAGSHACGEVASGPRPKGRGRKPSVKQEESRTQNTIRIRYAPELDTRTRPERS